MKFHIAGLLCASFCLPVFAAEGKWTSGYGQGNLEYFIDAKGVRLYIGCPTQEGSADAASSVVLTRLSDNRDFKAFSISVSGKTFEGPFTADSRVGADNFTALLDALRKSDAVVTVGNAPVTFAKNNAATVLPDAKHLKCNVM